MFLKLLFHPLIMRWVKKYLSHYIIVQIEVNEKHLRVFQKNKKELEKINLILKQINERLQNE